MKGKKIKLTEILKMVEFDYVINNDGTVSLVDKLGANLGGIESEIFKINENFALAIVDRLTVYIEDYIIDEYTGVLREECNQQADKFDAYVDLLEKMKKYPDIFSEHDLRLLAALDNPYELIDVSDIIKNSKISK